MSDLFKESLKRRYPELTNGIRSFKELWTLEDDLSDKRRSLRTAYEFLKFLRLAPLMPELPYEGIKDKKVKRNEKKSFQSETRVFNQAIRRAYNIMSTRYVNNNNIPGAQEQYRGVWDVTQTKEELTQTEARLTRTEKELMQAKDQMVESAVSMIIVANNNNPKLVQELIDQVALELQGSVRKQLKDRGVDISEAAKAAYDTGVRRRQFEPPTPEKDKKRRESSQVTGLPKFTGRARPERSRQARRSSTKPRNS